MNLGIILLTYNRIERAIDTLDHLFGRRGAIYLGVRVPPDCKVYLHIADDGSPDPYRRDIVQHAASHFPAIWPFGGLSSSDAERRGYGASYNLATQQLHDQCDYILTIEDDWRLTRELDMRLWLQVMEDNPHVNAIRFGYLGFTQKLYGEVVKLSENPNMVGILFDPDSPEPHVNAGHPRLERVSYQREVGPWKEGILPGDTEVEWCHRPASRYGVVFPLWDSQGPFAHTGTVKAEETIGATPLAGTEPEAPQPVPEFGPDLFFKRRVPDDETIPGPPDDWEAPDIDDGMAHGPRS